MANKKQIEQVNSSSVRKIDEELIKGCQRYLNELEKRNRIVEAQKEKQRTLEEEKAVRREYWRKMLYGAKSKSVTLIVPDDK